MKFLLINPPIDEDRTSPLFTIKSEIPPLGLLYIAASLEKNGHDVDLIDFCAEDFSEDKLLGSLDSVNVVGITVLSFCRSSVKNISDIIKKNKPDIKIIIGGPHCTINPEQALIDTHADICVKGEGEDVVKLIAYAIEGDGELDKIPGVFYLKSNLIKKGPPAEEIKDLDSLPYPSRHLVEKYKYGMVVGGYNPTRGKVTSIMISRGCNYNCRYCINKAITKTRRARSPKNVIKEIEEIMEKYDFLHIIDENFFVEKENAEQILDFLIEKNDKLELWISGIRVDAVEEKLFRKMKKAGVTTINMGIESGNQDILDYYNKEITLEQIKKAADISRKMGFFTIGYFILGAPVENEKHIIKTIEFAKKLPLDNASFSPFAYVKGSPIWQEAFDQGKILENEYSLVADSSRGLGNFTEQELWSCIIKAFKSFHLRPLYILDQIMQSLIRKDFRVIKEGFKLLLRNDNVLKVKNVEAMVPEINKW